MNRAFFYKNHPGRRNRTPRIINFSGVFQGRDPKGALVFTDVRIGIFDNEREAAAVFESMDPPAEWSAMTQIIRIAVARTSEISSVLARWRGEKVHP